MPVSAANINACISSIWSLMVESKRPRNIHIIELAKSAKPKGDGAKCDLNEVKPKLA